MVKPSGGGSLSSIIEILSITLCGNPAVFEKHMYLDFFLINKPLSRHKSASASKSYVFVTCKIENGSHDQLIYNYIHLCV